MATHYIQQSKDVPACQLRARIAKSAFISTWFFPSVLFSWHYLPIMFQPSYEKTLMSDCLSLSLAVYVFWGAEMNYSGLVSSIFVFLQEQCL